MIKLSAILTILLVVGLNDANRCYVEETNPYMLMGTRTAYQFARGNISRLPPESNCRPVQIWALVRHGTRYPGCDDVNQFLTLRSLRDRIVDNHDKRGKGQLCYDDLNNLRKWDLDPKSSEINPDYLTPTGEEELKSLGERLRAVFPDLLEVDPKNVSQSSYTFRATAKQRTQASLNSFMLGLFGRKNVVDPVTPPKNDSLLYTYKNCPAYEESLVNDHVDAETEKFTGGPHFQNVLTNVTKRLGFERSLDNDTLLLMYDMCRYERAWHESKRVSPWCAVFTDDDIRVLEYREDIGCYYYSGPGRRINEMLGCPLLKDLFQHFRNLEEPSNTEPKGIFYFSHTVTLEATMSAMGIGKDTPPLLSTNYETMKNRHFRTSLIGSFAANLIAVFYKCTDEKVPHKVMLHVSEKPWTLDGCVDGLCDWELLKQKFANQADQCNLDFCYR